MNKDVIYIDVEDDITAIISKVKSSKEKIVALVPPKRIGVLQSAVNLRLLSRAAEQGNKRLVVITSNHALMGLAASANLPVAKNLQSKPELAPIAAIEVDDGDDIIDGNDLPVGDHARQSEATAGAAVPAVATASQLAKPPTSGAVAKPKAKGTKVPNFNTFRKKLVFGIVAGILLIAFLVWAIFFAPRATVLVSAKTSDSSINSKVAVGDKFTTDLAKNTIKAVRVSKSEKKSVDFGASGSKNVGEKAASSVTFSTDSISVARNGVTIPAGSTVTSSSGLNFVTQSTVTLTLANSEGSTQVIAAEQGAKYNAASGRVTGAPSGVSAALDSPTSGGTDKVVKVVTAEDVERAREQLNGGDSKAIQNELRAQLKGAKAVQGSFRTDVADVKPTPEIGAETESGNAVLTATVNHVLYGLSTDEINKYLDAYLKKQLASANTQRSYENGADEVEFQDVVTNADGADLTIIATAKVGPKLDEEQIKKESLGRKGGEIQQSLQGIQGIQDVEVSYFPFWVGSVPDDANKVSVQFKVDD